MEHTLVSIIIPSFNRAHLISETLDSIIAQTYTNWECIVVDDGSTDHTLEVVSFYKTIDKRIYVYKRPNNLLKGANACRNYGIDVSKGRYLMLMDSDDILIKSCLKVRMSYILNTNLDFVVFNSESFINSFSKNISLNINNIIDECSIDLDLNNFLRFRIPWNIMSVLYNRNVFNEFNFDEDLKRLQDFEFHLRLLLSNKFRYKRYNNIDNYYRQYIKNREVETEKFNTKIASESFIKVFWKINFLIRRDDSLKKNFSIFIVSFCFNKLYKHIPEFDKEIKEIHLELKKNKYLSKYKLFFLKQIYYILKFNLQNIKGFERYYIFSKKQIRV